jgi:hypothetical protein
VLSECCRHSRHSPFPALASWASRSASARFSDSESCWSIAAFGAMGSGGGAALRLRSFVVRASRLATSRLSDWESFSLASSSLICGGGPGGVAPRLGERGLEALGRGRLLLRGAAVEARQLQAEVARRRLRGLVLRLLVGEVHQVLGGAAAESLVSAVVPLEEQSVGVAARVQDFEGALAEAGDQAAAAGVGGLVPAEIAALARTLAARAPHQALHLPERRHVVGRDGVLVDLDAA